jgi:sugar phosphate isomerase/epimerase
MRATATPITRRALIGAGAATLASAAAQTAPAAGATEFQIACMTLAYAAFPFDRAMKGIASAGYKYVGWAPRHKGPDGKDVDVLADTAPASAARELAARTRDLGLEPVMFFAVYYVHEPKALEIFPRRIEQAAAAKVPYILSFGNTKGPASDYPIWVKNLKVLGPMARNAGVQIVIKQHGGQTGTGAMCARIVEEVGDEGVKMWYDAGNNRWYSDDDPMPDLMKCVKHIRGFAIKDARSFPKKTICGPGFGEIDHYKLLAPVSRTGLKMPLAVETLWEPYAPRPNSPEGIDALAKRAREYLETVTNGLGNAPAA